MMPGRWLHVGSENATQLPAGWYDEIVIHTIRKNTDGTITAIALINLYDGKGECYSAERTIKLERRKNNQTRTTIEQKDGAWGARLAYELKSDLALAEEVNPC